MLAFASGAFLKLYDDFVDDELILKNEYATAVLRTLSIGITAIVLARDFWACSLFTIFNVACAISSYHEYTGPHVASFFALTPFVLAASWSNRSEFGSKMDIVGLSLIVGTGLVEAMMFQEESSFLKLLSRIGGFIFTMAVPYWFPLGVAVQTFFSISAGYCLASTFGQLVKLGFIPGFQKETY